MTWFTDNPLERLMQQKPLSESKQYVKPASMILNSAVLLAISPKHAAVVDSWSCSEKVKCPSNEFEGSSIVAQSSF